MIKKEVERNEPEAWENPTDRYDHLMMEAARLDELAYRALSSDGDFGGDWEDFSSIKRAAVSKREQAKRERDRADRLHRASKSENE
jgi:hypothetical protein